MLSGLSIDEWQYFLLEEQTFQISRLQNLGICKMDHKSCIRELCFDFVLSTLICLCFLLSNLLFNSESQ